MIGGVSTASLDFVEDFSFARSTVCQMDYHQKEHGGSIVAADWMKIRLDLSEDARTMQLASLLGVDVDLVVGKLIRLWRFGHRNTRTGRLDGVTEPVTLDTVTRHAGFCDALIKVGWLLRDADGVFRLPRWQKHNSKSAKDRALAADRAARYRSRKERDAHHAPNVTKASLEKRREEKRRITSASALVPLPPSLQTSEFAQAWEGWLNDRLARRKPVTIRAQSQHLAECAELGAAGAIAMIQMAINRSWTGLKAEWYRNANGDGKSAAAGPDPVALHIDKLNRKIANET